MVELEFFYRNLKSAEHDFIEILKKNDNMFNDESTFPDPVIEDA